jgi:hypothetical protein
MGPIALSIVIITVGIGWLLTVQGYMPGINWIWTLSLAVVGALTFVVSSGVDKLSVIVGPFFLMSSLLSVLRQTDRISIDAEIPILVIMIGSLLLLAQMPFIPLPKWFVPPDSRPSKRD